jgi:hypothetical protein
MGGATSTTNFPSTQSATQAGGGEAKPGSEIFKHQIGVRRFAGTHHATHRLLN